MNAFWPIVGPTVTAVEGVQVFDIAVKSLLRELSSIPFQSKVRKNPEPQPVGIGHAVLG